MSTTTELRGFVTGLILGGGKIDKGVEKRAFVLTSTNTDFIFRVAKYFQSNTNFKLQITDRAGYTDKHGAFHRPCQVLSIKAHPYFTKLYHHFYTDTRGRRISSKALSWLTPAGLANWYLSDGYIVLVGNTTGKIKDRRVELATDRYSEADVDRAIRYFEKEFGYTVSKVKRKPGCYRIRFSLKSAQHFLYMISSYVPFSMRYKLDLRYDYKPIWMTDEYYGLMMSLNSANSPTWRQED